VAITKFGGNLDEIVRRPAAEAKAVLRAFPKIGEPGAEKILLFSGRQPFLAPDSNALRVLTRLGLIEESPSYARMYAAARTLDLPAGIRSVQEAHLLLVAHGQTLCKRSAPKCPECPLLADCPYPRRSS
jgi:endonuclease III